MSLVAIESGIEQGMFTPARILEVGVYALLLRVLISCGC
jgi:hypothetical protein